MLPITRLSSLVHKSPISIATMRGMVMAMVAFGFGVGGSGAVEQNPLTAQQQFKNVQILKDLPAQELIPAMQFISASLGVQCDFCHVRDSFEKDDKETKQVARRMMSMMLAINGQNFRGERAVTCYTCHRGSAKAVAIPMIEATAPYLSEASTAQQERAQSGGDLPAAEEIVSRFVVAVGGEAALQKISTRIEKGRVTFAGGPSLEVEVSTKAPSKQAMTIRLPQGDATTAFDGEKGWLSAPGSPVHDMNEADFEGARLDSDLQLPLHLKILFHELKVIQRERVGDHDAILNLCHERGPLF